MLIDAEPSACSFHAI